MNRTRWAVVALVVGITGVAFAAEKSVAGKVVAVKGDVVTIEVEKGKAAELPEGAAVEVKPKEGQAQEKQPNSKDAPKKGADALQGC